MEELPATEGRIASRLMLARAKGGDSGSGQPRSTSRRSSRARRRHGSSGSRGRLRIEQGRGEGVLLPAGGAEMVTS